MSFNTLLEQDVLLQSVKCYDPKREGSLITNRAKCKWYVSLEGLFGLTPLFFSIYFICLVVPVGIPDKAVFVTIRYDFFGENSIELWHAKRRPSGQETWEGSDERAQMRGLARTVTFCTFIGNKNQREKEWFRVL